MSENKYNNPNENRTAEQTIQTVAAKHKKRLLSIWLRVLVYGVPLLTILVLLAGMFGGDIFKDLYTSGYASLMESRPDYPGAVIVDKRFQQANRILVGSTRPTTVLPSTPKMYSPIGNQEHL